MAEILFAAESLLPPIGGAELFALEMLGFLAARHRVRALWLREGPAPVVLPPGVEPIEAPAPRRETGYWRDKRARSEAVGRAVADALAARRADVVLSQLHAGPAALSAGRNAGAAGILMLGSYEALCKYAFDAGSVCGSPARCGSCPRALELTAAERREFERSRLAQRAALEAAAELMAPSRAVAEACRLWAGREPCVAAPVGTLPRPLPASPDGHVLLAGRWSPNKGLALLAPIARGLAPRRVVITSGGLPPDLAEKLERLAHVQLEAGAPLAELLDGAALALVPSQWPEPFGRVAYEALAAGVPTLASAVGGLPEFVPAPQLVRDHVSPQAWVEAARHLADPARWEEARESGLAAARAVHATGPLDRIEARVRAAAETA